jgi:hypothetical protein
MLAWWRRDWAVVLLTRNIARRTREDAAAKCQDWHVELGQHHKFCKFQVLMKMALSRNAFTPQAFDNLAQ